MATREIPLSRLGAELHQLSGRTVPDIGLEVTKEAMEDLFVDIAGPRSPKGSVSTSSHPGKYAASHKASVGAPAFAELPDRPSYPRLGITEVARVTEEMQLGEPGFITNDAQSDGATMSYAPILELGRHVDSLGRQAGSPQAPEGIYGPAIVALASRSARIVARGIRRAMRKAGLA